MFLCSNCKGNFLAQTRCIILNGKYCVSRISSFVSCCQGDALFGSRLTSFSRRLVVIHSHTMEFYYTWPIRREALATQRPKQHNHCRDAEQHTNKGNDGFG